MTIVAYGVHSGMDLEMYRYIFKFVFCLSLIQSYLEDTYIYLFICFAKVSD